MLALVNIRGDVCPEAGSCRSSERRKERPADERDPCSCACCPLRTEARSCPRRCQSLKVLDGYLRKLWSGNWTSGKKPVILTEINAGPFDWFRRHRAMR